MQKKMQVRDSGLGFRGLELIGNLCGYVDACVSLN